MEGATASETATDLASPDSAPATDTPTLAVHRPTDGSLIRELEIDPPERVAEVVARVRESQSQWEAIGIAGRRRWLDRLRDWMLANQDRLADVMQE